MQDRQDRKGPHVAVIGGGPAGLMAAEKLSEQRVKVDLFDRMPSVGRKILMAGKSGLNLSHGEPVDQFITRYGDRSVRLGDMVRSFDAHAVREWAAGLGVDTFVGSSGRIFPVDFKAAPLVRAWVRRLRAQGVIFHMRHRWLGWDEQGALLVEDASRPEPPRQIRIRPDAVVLALGGGSWARLGSDGTWGPLLEQAGAKVCPWRPANCGFDCDWSDLFRQRFAGDPVKTVVASLGDQHKAGEFVITGHGVEGSLIYAFSAPLRDRLDAGDPAVLTLDLLPGRDETRVRRDLARPRGAKSLSTYLRKTLGLDAVKINLLRELAGADALSSPEGLLCAVKQLPLPVVRPRPLDEAISTAGGVAFESLTDGLMLSVRPGVFCCGEMLDWEAPTGGYLITACLATGARVGEAVGAWLQEREET